MANSTKQFSISSVSRKDRTEQTHPMTPSTSPCISIVRVKTKVKKHYLNVDKKYGSDAEEKKRCRRRGVNEIDEIVLRKSILCLSAVTLPLEIIPTNAEGLDEDDDSIGYDICPTGCSDDNYHHSDDRATFQEWEPTTLVTSSWSVASFDVPPVQVVHVHEMPLYRTSVVTLPTDLENDIGEYDDMDDLDRIEDLMDQLSPPSVRCHPSTVTLRSSVGHILSFPLRISLGGAMSVS